MGGGGGDIIVLSMSHTTNQCNNVKKQSQYSILESIVIRAVKKEMDCKNIEFKFCVCNKGDI